MKQFEKERQCNCVTTKEKTIPRSIVGNFLSKILYGNICIEQKKGEKVPMIKTLLFFPLLYVISIKNDSL